MKLNFYFLLILLTASYVSASPIKIGKNVFLKAHRTKEVIKVDGRLDEAVWKEAPYSNFTQRDPDEGKPASEKTNVWIAYDKDAIYVAAKLYDSNPSLIKGRLTRRDNFSQSDWFMFFIDSYYDGRTGYYFAVNPANTVVDGTLYNDSWDETSWNGVWESAVTQDAEGWNVEIRVPYTQIRFKESDSLKWGINFKRVIERKNENDYMIMVPKKESGFVSHFATLEGLEGIQSKQRIEVLPYLVQRAQYLVHDANDPYYKSKQYRTTFGGDFKIGIGSNLTLDGTINPDFGQVEVDPAVINLSAFETYYDEKRPFFIEGNNIFYFGSGGANNNWNFNWSNPDFFYSRRIGRYPQVGLNDSINGPTYTPSETRILSALKLTGKLDNSLSIGVINAVTEKTYADLYNYNKETVVEPLANYSVIRALKEFNNGKQGLGFIATSVFRDTRDSEVKKQLAKNSYTFGMDGWTALDEDAIYVLQGYIAGSYNSGSKDFISKMQNSSIRYMQRPDRIFMRYDSSLTSLSGYMGRFALNKQKGNFYINSALGFVSPGFDVNNMGYQWRSDLINFHTVLGYRWYEPDGIFRFKSVYGCYFRSQDYDGNLYTSDVFLMTDLQFMNYYEISLQAIFAPEAYSTSATRGGPVIPTAASKQFNANLYSDSRKSIVFDVYYNYNDTKVKSYYNNFGFDVTWNPQSNISLSIGPFYELNLERNQWVDNISDNTAVTTYNNRYIFAELNQKTYGSSIRLNWTFTPDLSLQIYLQPLVSVGTYSSFKQVTKARSLDMMKYGTNNSSITYDKDNSEYTITPDNNNPANTFTVSDPNFNIKSIRGNVILRWEFMPGSAMFFVWTHSKYNDQNPGDFNFKRDIGTFTKGNADNIFLVKVNYWLNI